MQITQDDLMADQEGPIYGQTVTSLWKPLTWITEQWVYKGLIWAHVSRFN